MKTTGELATGPLLGLRVGRSVFCVEDVAGEKTKPSLVAFLPFDEWESLMEGDSWVGGHVECFVNPAASARLELEEASYCSMSFLGREKGRAGRAQFSSH